eukprot:2407228-Rhodomonas_salina.3
MRPTHRDCKKQARVKRVHYQAVRAEVRLYPGFTSLVQMRSVLDLYHTPRPQAGGTLSRVASTASGVCTAKTW